MLLCFTIYISFYSFGRLFQLVMKIIEKAVDVPQEIPEEVAYVFIAPYLMYIWPALEKIGFDCVKVAGEMWRLRNKIAPDSADGVWILYYGFHYIQPAMNEKLTRPADYPSWPELLRTQLDHIIKKSRYLKTKKPGRVQSE